MTITTVGEGEAVMATQVQKSEAAAGTRPPVDSPPSSNEPPDKLTIRRPVRAHLSPEETRARVEAFAREREEAFVAAVREDAD